MDWKKLGRRLLFPPFWLIAVISVVSAGTLVLIFCNGWEQSPLAYAAYVLAFYGLFTLCLFCWKVLPAKAKQIKKSLAAHPIAGRYLSDRTLRAQLALYLSLGISLLYVAINLLNWYWSRSWWFAVLAGYYTIMALMRFLLVRYVHTKGVGKNRVGEWKRARLCACILLLINLSLSGAVLMILYRDRGYEYPGIMIYVMAAYTFYATVHAIIEMIRQRALGSPVLSTARVVSLSAALVSMLNLETAMFAQFGTDMAQKDQNLFIILTGAGVSLIVITLSVLLIVSATKEIRRNTNGK